MFKFNFKKILDILHKSIAYNVIICYTTEIVKKSVNLNQPIKICICQSDNFHVQSDRLIA